MRTKHRGRFIPAIGDDGSNKARTSVRATLIWLDIREAKALRYEYKLKGLILAQNERWRRGLGMQVER